MHTKESALKLAQTVADERGEEMVVVFDPKANDDDHAYSVHTKASARTAIREGCSQIASYMPGSHGVQV